MSVSTAAVAATGQRTKFILRNLNRTIADTMDDATPSPILLFDGQCAFCDGTINFIIKQPLPTYFKFAHLQHPAVQKSIYDRFPYLHELDTIILLERGGSDKGDGPSSEGGGDTLTAVTTTELSPMNSNRHRSSNSRWNVFPSPPAPNTVRISVKSQAALRTFMSAESGVLRYLALIAFWLIPRILSDFVYDTIAANRFKIKPKAEECLRPTKALRARFWKGDDNAQSILADSGYDARSGKALNHPPPFESPPPGLI